MVVIPTLQVIEQSVATDPSGSRHLLSGAAGFVKLLGTGPAEELNFGSIQTSPTGAITDTKCVYARVSDFGSASGVFNLKFYLNNTSSFGAGTYRFLEQKEIHFVPNLELDSSANNTTTIVPTSTNLLGTNRFPEFQFGSPWLSGLVDHSVSQYVYLATEIGADVPVGQYNVAGGGGFRYRIIFDFS
jgi:hypothetical protein